MPPAVSSRMHAPHMSNPFQHLNTPHTIAQSHYPSQSQPANTNIPQTFTQHALNGGISPFNPSSAYGGSAFSTGAGASSAFNGGGHVLGGQGQGNGQGLASVAAQQGFARGAAMQEVTHQEAAAASRGLKSGAVGRIREVWRQNLDSEMAVLRQLILKYPYVSMDAEFPGIVARPIGNFAGSKAEYHYQTLRCNVDILKPIQVGLTLWTPQGELPPPQPDQQLLTELHRRSNNHRAGPYPNNLLYLPCTWVFNFSFDLNTDMFAESSIEMLRQSGVDFHKHASSGISLPAFGALLTTSGLAFNPDVNWLSFHSGYDFGYLIKLLTDAALPAAQPDFFALVSTFFPRLWDIKFLLRHAQRLRSQNRLAPEATRLLDSLGAKSGLQDLADELGCPRVGTAHTGGSDAWLTGAVFWAMREKVFSDGNGWDEQELADQIYGLHGVAAPASQQYREEFFAAQGGNGIAGSSGLQGGAQGYTPNPSTPTSGHVGLNNVSSQTPGPGSSGSQPHYGHSMAGSLGGQQAGGFGGFSYGAK